MRKILRSWIAVLLIGSIIQPALARQTEAPSGLILMVNSSLADAPDATPGNGICETASGNGVCTLRAAIMEANASPGADEVSLPAGTFTLTRVGYDNTALNGDLDITGDLLLHGVDFNTTIIDGNGNLTIGRVLHILPQASVTIRDLRVINGNGPYNTTEYRGGGILNEGTLTLLRVSVRNNKADQSGGIENTGTLSVQGSFITDNGPSQSGTGGIYSTGTLEVIDSRISSNLDSEYGGIRSTGTLSVVRSTIATNVSDEKGGILIEGSSLIKDSTISNNNGGGMQISGANVTLLNTTISGNFTPGDGGGLYIYNTPQFQVSLHNVTIVNNVADSNNSNSGLGGGIYVAQGTVNLANTLLANNVVENGLADTPDDCFGTLTSLGYNLIETPCTIVGTLTGNKTGQDPLLAPLANNGGPTLTHALLAGSPAIDAANPAGCGDPLGAQLPFDQRGYLRHFDGGLGSPRCDMGAYETLATAAKVIFLPVAMK